MRIFLALFLCISSIATAQAQPAGFPGVDPNVIIVNDFEDGTVGQWSWRAFGRGDRASLEIASRAKGDPVRFGDYALKFNIDFTNADPNQTIPAFISPREISIPGNYYGTTPKRLGMWVYATPGVQGMWFRIATRPNNGSGRGTPSDFTAPGYGWTNGRINWTGWRYVTLDLPPNHELHPDGLRFIVVNGFENYHVNGFIIIDNIRITEQSFQEDLTPPVITSLTVNGRDLSTVSRTNTINLSASFHDNHDNSSGINYDNLRFIINGQPFKLNENEVSVTYHILNDNDVYMEFKFDGLQLANGTHTVTVHVEDNFGHITTKTETLTINNPSGRTTTVALVPADEAEVGNPFAMAIRTNNPKDIKELEFVVQVNNVGSFCGKNNIVFIRSLSAYEYTFDFNPRNGHLTINLKNDITVDSGWEDLLAVIYMHIFENINPNYNTLRISPVSARVVYADGSSSLISLFDAFEREISATYDFTVLRRIVGAPGEVLVTDLNGNPQAGATARALNADMTEVLASAVSNENGIASGMNFTEMAQGVNIFVERNGKFSYTRLIQTLNPLLTNAPTNIKSGTTPDPTTMKTITWKVNPVTSQEPAMMKIAKKSDGESHFQKVFGETKILEYTGASSPGVAKGNSVRLTGLQAGTTYIYRVGDGVNWSPTREFTTTTVTDRFSFSAFGDLQASQWAHMDRFLAAATTIEAMNPLPFFSLNVADIVDTDDRWDYIEFYGHLFNERPIFANIDMIAAFGNHEYMGTPNADNIKFVSGIPRMNIPEHLNAELIGTGTYAVKYGNMIVVALDWEGREGATATEFMTEQARWMDYIFTKYAHKTWRIVTLHYPIFPNASTAGSQEIYGPIFDKHNVQIVFCGHGHTFERVQVRNGKLTSPADDRRHFQPTIDGGTLHFQLGGMKETNRHGRWIHAQVDGKKITFTVFDHENNIVPEEGFVLRTK